ncbi:MAG: T9SS type A sorting domain-containing protein [Candidatus Cloacimonetes bacterium]|nr:T9SS type A sorting domain-containing protein [Candidatus Cloacimonadota bacterium]
MITVYPNPAREKIIVEYAIIEGWNNGQIGIYNMQGKLLVSKPINKQFGFKTMDVSGLANGNYIISVGNRGIKGFTKQISIIH